MSTEEIKNNVPNNAADHQPGSYDESQIQVLEGLEAVRKRPGMYIGGTDSGALHHLVREIVDNSIDEALAGHCDRIEVTVREDGGVSVRDNGRGIPTGMNAKLNKPTPEVVFTVLHAGGKFGGEGYTFSGGLHGVGASAVNALSTRFYYEDYHNGEAYCGEFSCGKPTKPYTHLGPCGAEHGLYVCFTPDPTIFDAVEFSYDVLLTTLREQAFLNAGLTIVLRDTRGVSLKEEALCYEGGIRSFVNYIAEQKKSVPVHNEIIYLAGRQGGAELEIALQYNDGYGQDVLSFSNNIYNRNGGTHESGFRYALRKAIADSLKRPDVLAPILKIVPKEIIPNLLRGVPDDTLKNDAVKKFITKEVAKALAEEKPEGGRGSILEGDDVTEGLIAIVSIKLPESLLKFKDQAKTELVASEARKIVSDIVTERLALYFEEHQDVCIAIITKAIKAALAREAARKARESARNQSFGKSGLPEKLVPCTDKNPQNTELFIVEGDSALGVASTARFSAFQAILPLRGKILNVEKKRTESVVKNESITPIIASLGCGIGEEFDIERLRYGKIVLMSDADVDGAHIRILLLTFLYRYMRPLIENGNVFFAKPPLYTIRKGANTIRYACDDIERDAILAELGPTAKIGRNKGLGEMDEEDLRATTMDPKLRTLVRVEIEDAQMCDEIFTLLMGEEVEPRRDFIEKNATYVDNLDV